MVSQLPAENIKIGYINANHFPKMISLESRFFHEPLDESDFRFLFSRPDNIGRTIEYQGNFVGFFIHKKNKPLVTRVAINSDYPDSVFTDKAMEHLVGIFKKPHITFLVAHVNRGELRAQLLLERMKFRLIRESQNFFKGEWKNSYLMAYYSYPSFYNLVDHRNRISK